VTLFENEFDTLKWDTFLDFVSKQDGDEDVIILSETAGLNFRRELPGETDFTEGERF
jgi:hypothetical protein